MWHEICGYYGFMTGGLYVIQAEVGTRAGRIVAANEEWPCRKGCDDCCRSLAAVPVVTGEEWHLIEAAVNGMEAETAEKVRRRIRESAGVGERPVVCPLLETSAGSCLVYESRPIACRAYGFYAEREKVLGCGRIERIARERPDVVWGNHLALADRVRLLGPARALHEWLDTSIAMNSGATEEQDYLS